ncbi:MAG: M1 family metallopeptidase [Candidatus Levybacteria bacterium]|nr:M1 family metallopeptidase [Candidatus Levybacteria bacterium]
MASTSQRKVLLPQHVTPQHYDIFLAPDLENFTFEGEETIKLTVTKPTLTITLHSAELEVFEAKLIGKIEQKAQEISYNDLEETVTITFDQKIPSGKCSLRLTFAGILNNKMRGFYRSRYTHNGKTYHMGVTQFESTDARRAFPCFDEPAQKATFEVSLKVPSDRTVISNTLEEETIEHAGGFKVVRFEKSPKMSSYLLAFIIGHFEYIEKVTEEGVKVRVYVTPGKKPQAKFALDVAAKIMSFYHDYFGIAYPLPTMDLIAIPDFANGAMENWGAVTYRETALLVDEDISSLHTKQWVALIIAHELAHQWFGNLVTMKWWTHLWLNEGFASFMEYLAVDKLFPSWRVWTQFVFTEQAKALSLDGLFNTHPIEVPVRHPGEISEIFDTVSYSKGASVIRMLEAYIGEKNFQKGLKKYLRVHKYSNAETQDLWKALEEVSGKPVGKIMKNWTSKPGYPLISFEKSKNGLTISQERFYSSPLEKNEEKTKWLVPMSMISDDKKNHQTFLIDKESITLKNYGKSRWIKANAYDTSFVRIKYSEDLRMQLEVPIKNGDKRITEEGRFALIRDAFALVESGEMTTDQAFAFLTSYKNEESYIVWAEIVTHLLGFLNLLHTTSMEEPFREFGREILGEIVNKVGWTKKKGEEHEQTLLRSTVIYALGTFGSKKIIDHANKIFTGVSNGSKIDSDLRSIVYSLVAENGGEKEYLKFKEIYENSKAEEEKDRALRALASFKNPALLKKTLTLGFSIDVRAQDAFKVIYLVCANPLGIDIAWGYVKENWAEICERFAGGHLFARFISPFAKFKTFEHAKDLETFFKNNQAEGIDRTVAQTLEKIRSNADLVRRDKKRISEYLNR